MIERIVMDMSDADPLDQEIASLEAAIETGLLETAELEALRSQKQQNLAMLSVEIKALRRAAGLRPASA